MEEAVTPDIRASAQFSTPSRAMAEAFGSLPRPRNSRATPDKVQQGQRRTRYHQIKYSKVNASPMQNSSRPKDRLRWMMRLVSLNCSFFTAARCR